MDLPTFVLAAATYLDPEHDHTEIAAAIATVVAEEPALFRDDEARTRTASLVIAVAWREGSLRRRVHGDCDVKTKDGVCIARPHSYCTAQINDSVGGSEAHNDDPLLCIRTAVTMLRQSMRGCSLHPIALYASGPTGCTNERAQRISRDRIALAHRIHKAARVADAKVEPVLVGSR